MSRPDEQLVAPGDPERVAGVLDLIRRRVPIEGLRVLDLACRTGAFSTAIAQSGAAEVLGIEGRLENYVRIPPTPNARYNLGDVRDLSAGAHGWWDVTLCLGILYHLDAVDAVKLLRAMREVTTGFAIIDTHIGDDRDTTVVDGTVFQGHWYGEPEGWWSAIGNAASWWFTPESLNDAIRLAGWTTIEHLPRIPWPGEPAGRHWLAIS
jgi:SAM-dependent methyltransferase